MIKWHQHNRKSVAQEIMGQDLQCVLVVILAITVAG